MTTPPIVNLDKIQTCYSLLKKIAKQTSDFILVPTISNTNQDGRILGVDIKWTDKRNREESRAGLRHNIFMASKRHLDNTSSNFSSDFNIYFLNIRAFIARIGYNPKSKCRESGVFTASAFGRGPEKHFQNPIQNKTIMLFNDTSLFSFLLEYSIFGLFSTFVDLNTFSFSFYTSGNPYAKCLLVEIN